MRFDVLFRTDASSDIGTGHVMRCLSLADAMRAHGMTVGFISRRQPGNINAQILCRGFDVLELPEMQAGATCGHGARWLEDAQHSARLVQAKPDWLISDHYGIDYRWHRYMRPFVRRILAITDFAQRRHDCDILLDQNLSDEGGTRYHALTPAACRRLLGPRYALLQPEYAQLHKQSAPRAGPVRRIMVFFGGADRERLCLRSLQAIVNLERPDIAVDIVAGIAGADFKEISELAVRQPQVRVHRGLPSLAGLMMQADLALGAGGATSWERLCLGLPCLVVTVADNQLAVTRLLAERGLVQMLGHARDVDAAVLTAALREWCTRGIAAGWFPDHRQLVDGRGVMRVCAAMMNKEPDPDDSER